MEKIKQYIKENNPDNCGYVVDKKTADKLGINLGSDESYILGYIQEIQKQK